MLNIEDLMIEFHDFLENYGHNYSDQPLAEIIQAFASIESENFEEFIAIKFELLEIYTPVKPNFKEELVNSNQLTLCETYTELQDLPF